MADAIPVHKPEPEEKSKAKPKAAPKSSIKEVAAHIPATPGNSYKLPDGTTVEDH